MVRVSSARGGRRWRGWRGVGGSVCRRASADYRLIDSGWSCRCLHASAVLSQATERRYAPLREVERKKRIPHTAQPPSDGAPSLLRIARSLFLEAPPKAGLLFYVSNMIARISGSGRSTFLSEPAGSSRIGQALPRLRRKRRRRIPSPPHGRPR